MGLRDLLSREGNSSDFPTETGIGVTQFNKTLAIQFAENLLASAHLFIEAIEQTLTCHIDRPT